MALVHSGSPATTFQLPNNSTGGHYNNTAAPVRGGRRDEQFLNETKTIITACVQLAMSGEVSIELNSPNKIRLVEIVDTKVRSQRDFFHSTCTDLELTPTDTLSKLMRVWEAIFENDTINVGRILSMLCFCQYVTVYAASQGLPSISESVPHWAAVFINARLKDWILSQGGWDSLQLPSRDNCEGTATRKRASWFEQGLRGIALTISLLDALQNTY